MFVCLSSVNGIFLLWLKFFFKEKSCKDNFIYFRFPSRCYLFIYKYTRTRCDWYWVTEKQCRLQFHFLIFVENILGKNLHGSVIKNQILNLFMRGKHLMLSFDLNGKIIINNNLMDKQVNYSLCHELHLDDIYLYKVFPKIVGL